MQTIAAGGEVDSMLLSGKMLIVGLHVSPEEGMVRAWNIDTGADVVLPGRHRVRLLAFAVHKGDYAYTGDRLPTFMWLLYHAGCQQMMHIVCAIVCAQMATH